MENKLSKEEYNNIPVVFCSRCLSLKIMIIGDMEYCSECSSTHVQEASIQEWEKLYIQKYHKPYVIPNVNVLNYAIQDFVANSNNQIKK